MRTRIVIGAASLFAALVSYGVAALFLPQLLLFPHHRVIEGVRIYSETPIPDSMLGVLARSNARLRQSAIFKPDTLQNPIYLTEGGLRWRLLALGNARAFALTRPGNEAIIINRSSADQDKAWSGRTIAGERALSAVIAHERTHTLIRREFGVFADRRFPAWVREGYCDYVAGSSTLSDEQAQDVRRRRQAMPALFYYDSRKRVTHTLATNNGSVRDLFTSAAQDKAGR